MKNILLIACVLAISKVSLGQQINYQVLENEPSKAYTKFIAPEIGTESNSTNLSVFLGANGRIALNDQFTIEGIARYDIYQLNGKGAPFLLEGGVFLPLTRKEKLKEAPVVLSYNPYAGTTYKNGQKYNVEETKYLKVPDSRFLNRTGVRGGTYLRQTGSENLTSTVQSSIFLGGIYLGGQYTSQAYVKTKINNDVERIGAGFTRIFADILVLPASNISNPLANDGLKADGSIGWRVGMQWYVSPHDGDYKFLGRSVFAAELGNRPLSGFMFNMSWGLAILESR